MNNLNKISSISKGLKIIINILIFLLPLYYLQYWLLINITKEDLLQTDISMIQQSVGLICSCLPLLILLILLIRIRDLLHYYINGELFLYEHVLIFKKIAKLFALWVIFSIIYEGIKSVIFSWNNINNRYLEIQIDANQTILIFMSLVIYVLALIVDEGRKIKEENSLTI